MAENELEDAAIAGGHGGGHGGGRDGEHDDDDDDDDEGLDDGSDVNGAMFLPAIVWPIIHARCTEDGIFYSLLVGGLGTMLMFLGSAMASGMFADSLGRRSEAVGWTVIVLLTTLYWADTYPWWGTAILIAVGLWGSISVWRKASLTAPPDTDLPDRVDQVMKHLPDPVPQPYAEPLEKAQRAFLTIRRYAFEDLADLDAINSDQLVKTAERSLVGMVDMVRRLIDMGESEALAEAVAKGRRRLDNRLTSLCETRDQVLILAQEKAAGHDDVLAEKTEALRLTVASLREVHALESET